MILLILYFENELLGVAISRSGVLNVLFVVGGSGRVGSLINMNPWTLELLRTVVYRARLWSPSLCRSTSRTCCHACHRK